MCNYNTRSLRASISKEVTSLIARTSFELPSQGLCGIRPERSSALRFWISFKDLINIDQGVEIPILPSFVVDPGLG